MANTIKYNDRLFPHIKQHSEENYPEESGILNGEEDPLGPLRREYDSPSALDVSTVRAPLNRPYPSASIAVARHLAEILDPAERKRLGVLLAGLKLREWCDAGITGRSRAIRRNIVLMRIDQDYTYEQTCAEISRKYEVSREAIRKHWVRFKAEFPKLFERKRKVAKEDARKNPPVLQ